MKALAFIKKIANQQSRNWSLKMNDQDMSNPSCGDVKEDTYYIVAERPLFGKADVMGTTQDGSCWYGYEIEV
jgi:hypothetical protein